MRYAQADSLRKMSKLQDQEPARSSFSQSRKREIQVQSMLSQVWNG
jgi:hypothetical protein